MKLKYNRKSTDENTWHIRTTVKMSEALQESGNAESFAGYPRT